jgi:hypothetical protein
VQRIDIEHRGYWIIFRLTQITRGSDSDSLAITLLRIQNALARTTAWASFVNIPALTSDRRVVLAARHFIEVHLRVSDVHLPSPFTTYRARC